MLSPPQNRPPQRTRCRQIGETDLEAVARLLAVGFPRTTPEHWLSGFGRMAAFDAVQGLARFGYLLESEQGPVGALLTIPSTRGARILCNLSGWYVDPVFRTHSTLLVSMATKLPHVTYLNVSPAPHTWRVIEALGFRRCNDGRSAVVPALARVRSDVRETVPGNLAERDLLIAHRGFGCTSFVCEAEGRISPFVFRPRRLGFPPVRMMELIYCRSVGDFARHAGAIGRHFLRQGIAGVICDGKVPGLIGYYASGKEPRYFKGPPPSANDLAYTERVIFET